MAYYLLEQFLESCDNTIVKLQRNPFAEQVPYKKALDDAVVEASNSVGEIIRFGKALKNSQDYFDNDIRPFLQGFIDDARLLSTYTIALFAAETTADHLGFIEELLNIVSDWSPVTTSCGSQSAEATESNYGILTCNKSKSLPTNTQNSIPSGDESESLPTDTQNGIPSDDVSISLPTQTQNGMPTHTQNSITLGNESESLSTHTQNGIPLDDESESLALAPKTAFHWAMKVNLCLHTPKNALHWARKVNLCLHTHKTALHWLTKVNLCLHTLKMVFHRAMNVNVCLHTLKTAFHLVMKVSICLQTYQAILQVPITIWMTVDSFIKIMCAIPLQVGDQSILEKSTSSKVTEIEDITYSPNTIHASENTQERFLPNEPECHSCTKLKAKVVKLQKKISYLTKRQQELISRTEKYNKIDYVLHCLIYSTEQLITKLY
ncbi:Hypothetical predicted protein [Paramuricea clavata]|uniref:Uncharacterized protein n=1 Tax=Paramuricea clavata TaxID=317549 RepID=A0A7D9H8V5_PARCT|nr:Hypothetical predicted protein [Paramuricea clavata]